MIRYESFTKEYGGRRAVDMLDLEVARGEVVGLLGPNGSGKTTSLKAAAGLLRPSSGSVLIGPNGLAAFRPEARVSISYLPQRVAFPESLSGREVVEFYRRLRRTETGRTDEVLKFASLNGASHRPVATYSGGMIQRLGLAVAALPAAEVLLLDEPTAALDPAGLDAFYALVSARRRDGRAVFFTSHQLGDIERIADRIAVLVEGRLAALLTARELSERMAERGSLRVRTGANAAAAAQSVRDLAPRTSVEGDEVVVPGAPSLRPAVLERLREAGHRIESLTAEEGHLEDLYAGLVEERR